MAAYSILFACFMVLMIFFYNMSSAAKYYIKFIFFIVSTSIHATMVLPIMFLNPRSYKNALIPAYLVRKCGKLIGVTWEVRGAHNIDNSTGNIVLLNHQSSIDLISLAILWPLMKEATVISKRAMFYAWPFGLCAWMWGTVFIDRSQAQQSQQAVNQTVLAIKSRKAKILLFPEGTRNSTEKLLPFKKGAFHAALDAGCPIQPVVISHYYFLDDKRPRFSAGHFIMTILPPVPTAGLTKADLPQLLDKCYTLMQETYAETTSEALQKVSNNNEPSYKQKAF